MACEGMEDRLTSAYVMRSGSGMCLEGNREQARVYAAQGSLPMAFRYCRSMVPTTMAAALRMRNQWLLGP